MWRGGAYAPGVYTWDDASGDVDVLAGAGCRRVVCEKKVSFPGLRFFRLVTSAM
jgi:hypothetical protein